MPSSDDWDAVVVGAGVAGGCVAALLADRGWRVLLVEKSAWPRETVCGGCLSASALNSLDEMGMSSAIVGASATRSVVWHAGGRSFEHPVPEGTAVLRIELDANIVAIAVQRGTEFLPGCSATLLPASAADGYRRLKLRMQRETMEIRAGLVIACDGLSGTLLKDEPWAKWTVSRNGFIGLAATFPSRSTSIDPGQIHMCMGKNGYVGRVRIDDSTEHLAAALDPAACRSSGGPLNLIGEILQSAGQSVPDGLRTAHLHGTGKLTRHRKQLGGNRVLVVGDACGYVEPVTGEGMAWATLGALELNRLLPASAADWNAELPAQWRDGYMRAIGRQQRWCRGMRTTMHHPSIAATGIFLANTFPGAARRIAQRICDPMQKAAFNDSIGNVPPATNSEQAPTENPGHRYRQPTGGAATTVA